MIDIGMLDNVIALVVVILVLSLIVQSIQAILKKAFKIKSRQIEDSLVDLFETALNKPGEKATERFADIPFLRSLFRRKRPVDYAHKDVQQLISAINRRFNEIGRVAQSGKTILDSIKKEDLMKVLEKVAPAALLHESQIKSVCEQIKELEAVITEIKTSETDVEIKAKLAALEEALAPLLNDAKTFLEGKKQGEEDQKPAPGLALENLLNLREIKLDDVVALLNEAQKKVEEKLETVRDTDAAKAAALGILADRLKSVASKIASLRLKYEAALAPLRAKLDEVKAWYDTINQSLEERYSRSMKTWALVISFLVVVYLNANILEIYDNISANETLQTQLLQAGEARLAVQNQELEKARQASDTAQEEKIMQNIKADMDNIKKEASLYTSLGFQPLTWQRTKDWGKGWKPEQDKWGDWWNRRKVDIKTLGGWLIMAFLLSIGAPFWQDTLESLFGVKNLIRNKAKSGDGT